MYRKFHGKKVAIDASVGLHTFAFVKARELTADDNDTSPFVDMFVARLKRHAREGIFPIVVFDGPSEDKCPGRPGLEGGFPLRCFQRLS